MKKNKLLIIIGFIVVVIIVGYFFWNNNKNNLCKDECYYNPSGKIWIFNESGNYKYFPEINQCLDYCRRHK